MWDELGIAPCADPKAIRRAYAARLKKLDPDRDPETFARLRTAFEWALSRAGDDDDARSSTTREFSQPTAARSSTSPVENAQRPGRGPPVPASDPDDIRDRALLIALNSALRRRDGNEATTLYYRAAATGALGLDGAREVTERLLAVAVDDLTLGTAVFRHLAQTIGVSTRWLRAPVASEVHQRAIARLQAEDWYDDLLAKAKQRKGREGRHQARIARLLLGRIGRYWSPNVDPTALKTRLEQCRLHAVWLGDRIDVAWLGRLEWRQRRGPLRGRLLQPLRLGSADPVHARCHPRGHHRADSFGVPGHRSVPCGISALAFQAVHDRASKAAGRRLDRICRHRAVAHVGWPRSQNPATIESEGSRGRWLIPASCAKNDRPDVG